MATTEDELAMAEQDEHATHATYKRKRDKHVKDHNNLAAETDLVVMYDISNYSPQLLLDKTRKSAPRKDKKRKLDLPIPDPDCMGKNVKPTPRCVLDGLVHNIERVVTETYNDNRFVPCKQAPPTALTTKRMMLELAPFTGSGIDSFAMLELVLDAQLLVKQRMKLMTKLLSDNHRICYQMCYAWTDHPFSTWDMLKMTIKFWYETKQ